VTRLGIVLCGLCAVLAGFLTVLLTPLYWGGAIIPVSVVLAVAANVGLPLLVRQLGAAPLASAVPFVLWLITVLVLGTSRPEGDVLLPAGSGAQPWVTYAMLGAGTLAGGVTVMAQTVGRPPARSGSNSATQRPAEASRPAEPSQPAEPSRPQQARRPRPAGRTRGRR
jgi:Family of unknown function (DUF6113)